MLLELWLCDVRVVSDGARDCAELLRDCCDSGVERVAKGGSLVDIDTELEAGVRDSDVDFGSDWTEGGRVAIELAPTDSGFAET